MCGGAACYGQPAEFSQAAGGATRPKEPSVVPPYRLEGNPNCPLDVADVVFTDPIGTGFSYLAGKGAADFFGVDADANMTTLFNRALAESARPLELARLRLSPQVFARQLVAKEKQALGMYDSRHTLPTHNTGTDPVADDPALGQHVPGFVAAFHGYRAGHRHAQQ